MTASNDLERRITDFYAAEAPARAPDWVLESVLATVDHTTQRQAPIRLPWRFPTMNTPAKLAAAAVAIAATGAVGFAVLRGPGPSTGVDPTLVPSPSPSAGPSSSLALSRTFTSPVHGISLAYPDGWEIREATEPWSDGIIFQGSEFADVISSPDDESVFLALASQALDGEPGDQWAAEYLAQGGCGPTESVTIGGSPGLVGEPVSQAQPCFDGFTAVAWGDDRGYVVWGYSLDDRPLFDRILATVEFQPDQAWVRPALSDTFTSSAVGISSAYPDGWTRTEAEADWTSGLPNECDPACSEQFLERGTDGAFLAFASQPLNGQDGEAWAFDVRGRFGTLPGCPGADQSVSIDGAPAMVSYICEERASGEVDPPPDRFLTAMAWTGDRGYLITLYRVADREWFDQVLATVQLNPPAAAGSPAP